jgi:uncharacterized protein YbjQ (UPF0145 family)
MLLARRSAWLNLLLLLVVSVLLSAALPDDAAARNTRYTLKIAEVKADPRYAPNVPDDVAFYFANQPHPNVESSLGEFVTNRKGNSAGRPDEEACRWTMISALKQLHDRAIEEGGNAVINIVSYYRKEVFSSDTLYECHAGAIISAVALKGTVVKLKK